MPSAGICAPALPSGAALSQTAQLSAEAAQRGLAEAAGDAADRWRRCEAEAAAWRERLPALRAEAQVGACRTPAHGVSACDPCCSVTEPVLVLGMGRGWAGVARGSQRAADCRLLSVGVPAT